MILENVVAEWQALNEFIQNPIENYQWTERSSFIGGKEYVGDLDRHFRVKLRKEEGAEETLIIAKPIQGHRRNSVKSAVFSRASLTRLVPGESLTQDNITCKALGEGD